MYYVYGAGEQTVNLTPNTPPILRLNRKEYALERVELYLREPMGPLLSLHILLPKCPTRTH
jgi:hypothetical protein